MVASKGCVGHGIRMCVEIVEMPLQFIKLYWPDWIFCLFWLAMAELSPRFLYYAHKCRLVYSRGNYYLQLCRVVILSLWWCNFSCIWWCGSMVIQWHMIRVWGKYNDFKRLCWSCDLHVLRCCWDVPSSMELYRPHCIFCFFWLARFELKPLVLGYARKCRLFYSHGKYYLSLSLYLQYSLHMQSYNFKPLMVKFVAWKQGYLVGHN